MKSRFLLLASVVALLAGLLVAEPGRLRSTVDLAVDYPENELSTNLFFKLYTNSSLSVPVTNWGLALIVPATNRILTFPISAQRLFFVGTASNYWGEGFFSEPVELPDPPRSFRMQLR